MAVQYTQMDLLNKIAQNNYSYKNSYVKKVTEVDENVGNLQDNMSTFKKSMKWLKKYSSGATSKTRLEKELNSLIKSYNEMDKNADSITDKDIQKQMTKLEELFSENAKNFKKIGIEKVNGKYTLDSSKFEDADDKALDALFIGHDSFIGKADKILRKVEASADDAHYSKVERKMTSVTNYDEVDVSLAAFMTLAQQTKSAMSEYNASVQSGSLPADVRNAIETDLRYFAISAYKTYDEESGNLEKLNQLCRDNEEKLNKVGIYFDNDYKTMSYVSGVDMDTADFKDAYDELFGGNAEFGKKVQEYTGNVFNSIVKPDKIGVSVIDITV